VDDAGEPTRELVLASLRAAIETHLPGHKLTDVEYEQLADAILEMRAARQRLRGVPLDAEHAEERRRLREELAGAAADFEYVLEMSPAEFTARVQPGLGIDSDDDAPPEAADDEPEFLYEVPR
jgi:hypothetical protein